MPSHATPELVEGQAGILSCALKGNQGTLHAGASAFLDDPQAEATTVHATVRCRSRPIETRNALVSTNIGWLQEQHQWPGLQAIAKITRIRESTGKPSTKTAYYLFSSPVSAESANSDSLMRHRKRRAPRGRSCLPRGPW